MERDIESKRFKLSDYNSQKEMNEAVKAYMDKLRKDYPFYLVTKEFGINRDVLVRMTKPNNKNLNQVRKRIKEKEEEEKLYYLNPRERDKQRERQRQRERERERERSRGRERCR